MGPSLGVPLPLYYVDGLVVSALLADESGQTRRSDRDEEVAIGTEAVPGVEQ